MARANNSYAPLVLCTFSRRHPSLSRGFTTCQALVWFSLGGLLNALATILYGLIHTTPSIHHLQLGVLGYLISIAPLTFISQCRYCPSKSAFAVGILSYLYAFHCSIENPLYPNVLQLGSFHRPTKVEPLDLTVDLKSHLQMFYTQSI